MKKTMLVLMLTIIVAAGMIGAASAQTIIGPVTGNQTAQIQTQTNTQNQTSVNTNVNTLVNVNTNTNTITNTFNPSISVNNANVLVNSIRVFRFGLFI